MRLERFGLWRVALAAAFIALVGYIAYKLVEDPANQFFGKTLVSGPKDQPVVALTFDDGPNPPYTNRILDVLREQHVKATFFVVGRAVEAYPATVRRMVREGHAIGNHTWDHPHLVVQPKSAIHRELARTDEAIFRAAGLHTRLMRPPFGARDFAVLDQVRRDGYTVVMWSVPLPKDWERPGAAAIVNRVVKRVKDGSIIVLHDGNRGLLCGRDPALPARVCDRSQDVGATRSIVMDLSERGFRFVTIPELLRSNSAHGIKRRSSR